ncbi:MAG: class I SAM-dependent methyltransferase [Asgard group archaeon]|nr:class I SAM-dependent methyltransferase [Asgard group archaeon]
MINDRFTNEEFFELFIEDATHPFSGWDFSYINNRMISSLLTWSYDSIVIPFIRKSEILLDMGTGGGEKLASLQPLPKKTFATEGYEPNIPIAKKTLEPLGVQVVKVEEDNKLAFTNDFFDTVINRHESYSPKEVKRVLKPNGYFITQQVGGDNDLDINRFLEAKINDEILGYMHWNLEFAINQLKDEGFSIIKSEECFPVQRCFDVGAIIYHLKAIPWQISDFSIEKYRNKLFELHNEIQEKGYFDIANHRFLIIARKE